mmetsp:Transcript_98202/g.165393  ORF Transcript_98202/g.165393 Transcript_98202/m.165393 type:complete len:229 (+) Transcript_98202:410-1096(+)
MLSRMRDLARSVLIVKAYSWAASSRPPKGMGRGSNKRLSHHSGTTSTSRLSSSCTSLRLIRRPRGCAFFKWATRRSQDMLCTCRPRKSIWIMSTSCGRRLRRRWTRTLARKSVAAISVSVFAAWRILSCLWWDMKAKSLWTGVCNSRAISALSVMSLARSVRLCRISRSTGADGALSCGCSAGALAAGRRSAIVAAASFCTASQSPFSRASTKASFTAARLRFCSGRI